MIEKIQITENSLIRANDIIKNMKSKTFHNHFHILFDICDSINKTNITYLEIGCYAGATASLVSTNKKVKKVVSVDIGYPINKNIATDNVNNFKHNECSYEYIENNSCDNEILSKLKKKYDKFDIIYIDGNHSYDGVICDFKLYSQVLQNDGYIIFDDYMDETHSPEVKIAVDDILQNLIGYNIIGNLTYPFLNKTNVPGLERNNLFILKKNSNE